MKRALGRGLVLIGIVAALRWVRVTYFTEEARVRRTLRSLLADFNFPTGTGNIAKVARFNHVMGLFTDDITISLDQVVPQVPPLTGREDLQASVQATFTLLSRCDVTLHDVVVEPISPESRDARAAFTASVMTSRPGMEFAAQEFEVNLRRNQEGRWQLARVTAVRTLKR